MTPVPLPFDFKRTLRVLAEDGTQQLIEIDPGQMGDATMTRPDLGDDISYVATPYSKYPGGLHAAYLGACRIAAGLIKRGFIVYCPIAHCHPIAMAGGLDPLDYKLWLPINEPFMRVSKRLFVAHMDGWNDSVGIADEVKAFEAGGKVVLDLDPVSLAVVKRGS